MSENVKWGEAVKPIPYKTVQLKLFSPFTELPNANALAPRHVRADLPPYHDILSVHCTGKPHLGGAGAVEIGKAERSSSHVGVEVALPPTKDERMFWVSC